MSETTNAVKCARCGNTITGMLYYVYSSSRAGPYCAMCHTHSTEPKQVCPACNGLGFVVTPEPGVMRDDI